MIDYFRMMFSMRKVLVKTATIAPAKVKWEAQLKALNMKSPLLTKVCSVTLLRFNCTSKPSLTSKPLLTIALKILKTIEKPLIPMVGPSKNIQW